MRIALFTEVFLPKIDGITNRLRYTIEHLISQGHEVRIFAPAGSVPEHGGAEVERIAGILLPPYPEIRISAPDPRIVLRLLRWGPDLVHVVNPACLGLWGALAATLLRIPIVASFHTDLPRYLKDYSLSFLEPAIWPFLRRVHGLAHLNLCPSRFTREDLHAHGIEGVGIWRGGVDTELFHPRRRSLEMRERLAGRPVTGPLLLSVGRLSPEKNLESLLPVLDAHPDATLAFVGDGPARAAIERTFAGRRANFVGYLRGEELAAAFASADLFLMPSRTETLGFVVLEAMSAGCPVVAARAGGIPDLVVHEETGLLYDPGDPRDLLAAVTSLLEHPAKRRFHARLARKRAEESTWASETRELVRHYRKTVAIATTSRVWPRIERLVF
ncbi:MAG TPA: glycosyl transferase [Deltaproteobacteria bacterium]|jgi:glycosyltransferase involved in cell wall biosynthesis|nr:glycosyl transferase [Deltaproteobacteria bacterium]